jgi:hypothetical protein
MMRGLCERITQNGLRLRQRHVSLLARLSNGRKTPIFSPDGSLPDFVGALISTDQGLQHLLSEELAKAKGTPSGWISQGVLGVREVNSMTSLHLWAAVAASLDDQSAQDLANKSTPSIPLNQEPIWMAHSGDGSNWEWKAPDLSPGSDWYLARVASL